MVSVAWSGTSTRWAVGRAARLVAVEAPPTRVSETAATERTSRNRE
jgi:hypothetical protein